MKKRILVLLLVLALGIVAINNLYIDLTKYTELSKAVKESQKIVVISDFYNTDDGGKIVDIIEHLDVDAILLVGDFINEAATIEDLPYQMIDKLVKKAPVLYVSGDQEWANPNFSVIVKSMINHGVRYMDNQIEVINGIAYVGVEDPTGPNLPVVIPEMMESLDYDFSIVMAHRPEYYEIYKSWKLDLIVSGHTHGGYITLPYIGGVYAKNQGFFPKFTHGRYDEQATAMIISRGAGNTGLPIRLLSKPELVLITIDKGK